MYTNAKKTERLCLLALGFQYEFLQEASLASCKNSYWKPWAGVELCNAELGIDLDGNEHLRYRHSYLKQL